MTEKQIVWKQEKSNRETGQWWGRALLIIILQLLLLWGTCRLVNNIYGAVAEFATIFKGIAVFFTGAISFWNEWKSSVGVEYRRKKIIGNIAVVLGVAFLLWRLYAKEAIILVEGILLAAAALMQIIGGMLKKRGLVCLIPIVVVCMGLLEMKTPQWRDLVFLLISGVLLVYLDSCERISWKRMGILGAFVLLLLWGTGHYQEEAEKQMLSMNGDWFHMWEKLGEKLEKAFEDFELSDWSVDKEVVDNKPPEFDDEQVILLTMSQRPVGVIYLRGYHCNNYEDGVWVKDTKAFEEACKKYGIRMEEAAEKLILHQYEQEDIYDNQPISYELSYTGIRNEYCYFPYGIGWEETPDFALSQDYLVKKATREKESEVTGWQRLYHLNADPNTPGEFSIFQSWYNEFVYENYLSVWEEQKAVKRLANEMSGDSRFAPYVTELNPKTTTYGERNAARLQVARLVAEWLKSQGTYSLELDKLPGGTDTIEYFLENSMEGFCEHFASAGTLLLRELGVPARYVRGYVVKSGAITASEDGYTASVLDSYAHAWTEIYLDNYGWVPIEMTPGYSSVDVVPQPEVTMQPEVTVTPAPEKESPEEDVTPTEAPTVAPEDVTGPTEVPSQSEGTGELPQEDLEGSGKEPSKGEKSIWRKVFTVIVLVCFIACISVMGYNYMVHNRGRSRKRLAGYMRRGENRKSVKWINEAMYRQLVHKERKYSKIKDDEFLAALKCEFPEVEAARWETYFEVVRKAAYSADRVTPEEVKECYALYEVVQQGERNW